MKFSNILSGIFAVMLIQACNPMDDILSQLEIPDAVVADLDITLTADDYDFVGQGFGNFSSEDDAKALIPKILAENYPQLGKGSSAQVKYDLYHPVRINTEHSDTLTKEDYTALGQNYGNLSSDAAIFDAAEYKFPDFADNDVVTITYEWYCSGCPEQGTRTSKVTYYDGRWYNAYVPTREDYTFMGQSYANFDSRTTARARIAKVLGLRYLFDDPGTIRTAVFVYTYVDGSGARHYEDFMTVYQFDGTVWQPFEDVVQRTLQLGHDGTAWVPDNTIKYSLTGADYVAIAASYTSINPSGATSMASYGNYDLTLWPFEDILSSISQRLIELFPAVEGQKYLVSYDTWEPGAGVRALHVIYQGGTYVQVQ